jgi:hypothetical protein
MIHTLLVKGNVSVKFEEEKILIETPQFEDSDNTSIFWIAKDSILVVDDRPELATTQQQSVVNKVPNNNSPLTVYKKSPHDTSKYALVDPPEQRTSINAKIGDGQKLRLSKIIVRDVAQVQLPYYVLNKETPVLVQVHDAAKLIFDCNDTGNVNLPQCTAELSKIHAVLSEYASVKDTTGGQQQQQQPETSAPVTYHLKALEIVASGRAVWNAAMYAQSSMRVEVSTKFAQVDNVYALSGSKVEKKLCEGAQVNIKRKGKLKKSESGSIEYDENSLNKVWEEEDEPIRKKQPSTEDESPRPIAAAASPMTFRKLLSKRVAGGSDGRDVTRKKAKKEQQQAHAALARATDEELPEDDDMADSEACQICFGNKAIVCFVPCGHIACCAECTRKQKESSDKSSTPWCCPMCKTLITNVVRTYKVK